LLDKLFLNSILINQNILLVRFFHYWFFHTLLYTLKQKLQMNLEILSMEVLHIHLLILKQYLGLMAIFRLPPFISFYKKEETFYIFILNNLYNNRKIYIVSKFDILCKLEEYR